MSEEKASELLKLIGKKRVNLEFLKFLSKQKVWSRQRKFHDYNYMVDAKCQLEQDEFNSLLKWVGRNYHD